MKQIFRSQTCRITMFGLLLCASQLSAQVTPAPTPTSGPDKATLKAQLDIREKRADLLLDELRASDNRIEETIDRVLDTLKQVGDSKDSRTKMARVKEETIDGLQKNIAYYQQKRASMQEELRRPSLHLSVEEKQRFIARLDARIEKRVQQIIALSKSLPTHKDYEKYTTVSNGWYGATVIANEDYKQNKRLTSHTDSQHEEVTSELQRSIARIDQQNRTLRTQLARTTQPASLKMLQEEIGKNEALVKTRRAQLYDVETAGETASRPVSNKEAQNMDMALRRTVDSLRRDLTSLFQRISSYMAERSNVNAAQAALDGLKR